MNFPVFLRRELAKRVGTGRLIVMMGFPSSDTGWDTMAREQRGIQTHQQIPIRILRVLILDIHVYHLHSEIVDRHISLAAIHPKIIFVSEKDKVRDCSWLE